VATTFTSLSEEAFSSLFRDFRHTAYRLETLQAYNVEYEEAPFRAYLSGAERYTDPGYHEWLEVNEANKAAGKTMGRVHIVTEPIADYVRYELLWPYRDNVAAGEDIQILPVTNGEWPSDLPHEDYWLFDSTMAVIMRYDDTGAFTSAEVTESAEALVQYNYWRDLARHLAIPYEEYLQRL
jgi:hypothetical protein